MRESDRMSMASRNNTDNEMRKEQIKQRITLFWKKIFGGRISPEDKRTIQRHKGAGGGTDYYILSGYLQKGESFTNVVTEKADTQNGIFIYRGIVQGADNAVGIIESNVPLSEVVSSPYGNETFMKMLSEENSANARNNYYLQNGLPTERLEGHYTFWANSTFYLGKIIREYNGRYSFNNFDISKDVYDILKKEREEKNEKARLRSDAAVHISIGNGIVVANMDCSLYDSGNEGLGISGTNIEAIPYKYTGLKDKK